MWRTYGTNILNDAAGGKTRVEAKLYYMIEIYFTALTRYRFPLQTFCSKTAKKYYELRSLEDWQPERLTNIFLISLKCSGLTPESAEILIPSAKNTLSVTCLKLDWRRVLLEIQVVDWFCEWHDMLGSSLFQTIYTFYGLLFVNKFHNFLNHPLRIPIQKRRL